MFVQNKYKAFIRFQEYGVNSCELLILGLCQNDKLQVTSVLVLRDKQGFCRISPSFVPEKGAVTGITTRQAMFFRAHEGQNTESESFPEAVGACFRSVANKY